MIGINTIVECNQYLQQNGHKCKIHLKDGCNTQYMWLELLEDSLSNDLTKAIIDFFATKRVTLSFSEDKLSFWEAN